MNNPPPHTHTHPTSARHFGSGAVEAEGGGMLSVSEGRQINTTKHFGGGVNVSAGATLLNKGWCSLSLPNTHTHKDSYTSHVTQ